MWWILLNINQAKDIFGMAVSVRLSIAFLLLFSKLFYGFLCLISSYITGYICYSFMFFCDESCWTAFISRQKISYACQHTLGRLLPIFCYFQTYFSQFLCLISSYITGYICYSFIFFCDESFGIFFYTYHRHNVFWHASLC